MTLTREQWRIERARLIESITSAAVEDRRGLIEDAFRRAIDMLDERPDALSEKSSRRRADAALNKDYDALGGGCPK